MATVLHGHAAAVRGGLHLVHRPYQHLGGRHRDEGRARLDRDGQGRRAVGVLRRLPDADGRVRCARQSLRWLARAGHRGTLVVRVDDADAARRDDVAVCVDPCPHRAGPRRGGGVSGLDQHDRPLGPGRTPLARNGTAHQRDFVRDARLAAGDRLAGAGIRLALAVLPVRGGRTGLVRRVVPVRARRQSAAGGEGRSERAAVHSMGTIAEPARGLGHHRGPFHEQLVAVSRARLAAELLQDDVRGIAH